MARAVQFADNGPTGTDQRLLHRIRDFDEDVKLTGASNDVGGNTLKLGKQSFVAKCDGWRRGKLKINHETGFSFALIAPR